MILKRIQTLWEVRTYDVWGNSKDGFEVSDSTVIDREYPIVIKPEIFNAGLPTEFISGSPSDTQIKKVFGVHYSIDINSTGGDDLNIYVNRARDDYPLGELHCVSHDSLSPIREKKSLDPS
jgi:hypothetical protein